MWEVMYHLKEKNLLRQDCTFFSLIIISYLCQPNKDLSPSLSFLSSTSAATFQDRYDLLHGGGGGGGKRVQEGLAIKIAYRVTGVEMEGVASYT